MKNSEVKNKHKNKDGELKIILSIWSLKRKRSPYGRLTKQKVRFFSHRGMQQWGIRYWETYAPDVNLDKCEVITRYRKYTLID